MSPAANTDVGIERVAVQAAVLQTLRCATGGETVWPWSLVTDLRLAEVDRVVPAQARSADLHVHLTAADIAGDGTVGAFVDPVLERVVPRDGEAR